MYWKGGLQRGGPRCRMLDAHLNLKSPKMIIRKSKNHKLWHVKITAAHTWHYMRQQDCCLLWLLIWCMLRPLQHKEKCPNNNFNTIKTSVWHQNVIIKNNMQLQYVILVICSGGCAGVSDLVPFRMRSFVLGAGILQGLSSNGWAVLESARLSRGIHLMSQDWIHLLRLSICFCRTDTSVRFGARLFSFLTSSQESVILLNTIIPSEPAL